VCNCTCEYNNCQFLRCQMLYLSLHCFTCRFFKKPVLYSQTLASTSYMPFWGYVAYQKYLQLMRIEPVTSNVPKELHKTTLNHWSNSSTSIFGTKTIVNITIWLKYTKSTSILVLPSFFYFQVPIIVSTVYFHFPMGIYLQVFSNLWHSCYPLLMSIPHS